MYKIIKMKSLNLLIAVTLLVGLIITPIKNVSADTDVNVISIEPLEVKSNESKITILHTNDTHGRIVPDKTVIGIDVVAAIKNSIVNSLLVDVGDTVHGLPFATMNKGADIVELMKMTGYSLMTPGNHDFNYGYKRLLELRDLAITGSNGFDILSANVMNGSNPLLNTSSIKVVDGVKIGFFGLSTPETLYKTNPNNVTGLDFKDPVEIAKNQVKDLEAQGVEVIVALSHLGTDKSSEVTSDRVAKEVEGIDVIIDGHSHSYYPNGLQAENNTLIASVGQYRESIGKIEIIIDKSTKNIVNKTATTLSKNDVATITPDVEVSAKMKEIQASQSLILSQVIGNSIVELDGVRANVRTKETNLGNLLTDAMLNTTGAEIAITNGGGIRSSINEGQITKEEVIKVLPFGNFIVTKYLTGSQIKDVLEHGVKGYPAEAGSFAHVGGIKYSFDKDLAVGHRILSITFNNKPLEMDKKYLVATNDFMAVGGDDYPHFKGIKTEFEFNALEESLGQYIQKIGDIKYAIEGRVVVATNTIPVITANDVTLEVGQVFNPIENITAVDIENGNLNNSIKVKENTVDINKAGEYKVVYTVTDTNGAVATKEIKVTVKNKEVTVVPETGGTVAPDKDIVENDSGKGYDVLPNTGANNPIYLILFGLMLIAVGVFVDLNKRKLKVQ